MNPLQGGKGRRYDLAFGPDLHGPASVWVSRHPVHLLICYSCQRARGTAEKLLLTIIDFVLIYAAWQFNWEEEKPSFSTCLSMATMSLLVSHLWMWSYWSQCKAWSGRGHMVHSITSTSCLTPQFHSASLYRCSGTRRSYNGIISLRSTVHCCAPLLYVLSGQGCWSFVRKEYVNMENVKCINRSPIYFFFFFKATQIWIHG